jgi:hypothetical protein
MMKKILMLSIMISTLAFAKGMHQAEVQETMNSGGYTYMKVSEGGKSYWIAATKIDIQKGAKIQFAEEMSLQNFQSKTLKRTFENIMFVSEIAKEGSLSEEKSSHKQRNIHTQNALANTLKSTQVSSYKKEGMLSVAEAFSKAKSLAGKTITIRGKVTKVSRMIMGKNWVHIQDGTGDAKTNDIVFTTPKETPKVGEVVTAQGTVAVDKDFGYGYFYPVIIEQSSFKK